MDRPGHRGLPAVAAGTSARRTDAADGETFPYIFPLSPNYWTQAGLLIDYFRQQDGDLNGYSQILRSLAQKFHCSLVDLREAFHNYELKNNPGNKDAGILTVDRVHLNDNGNRLVADKMLEALLAK